MAAFDHTTWIDDQRAAGDKRGNVFKDILAACAQQRQAGGGLVGQALVDRRVARVEGMRAASAEHDAAAEKRASRRAAPPSFSELVDQWKGTP